MITFTRKWPSTFFYQELPGDFWFAHETSCVALQAEVMGERAEVVALRQQLAAEQGKCALLGY